MPNSEERLNWVVYESTGDTAGDEFKKYDPDNYPKDCFTEHAANYPKQGDFGGFTVFPLLECYWGRKFDAAVYYALSAFNPTAIRVIRNMMTADAYSGRVTVQVDKNNIIERIEQEVRVILPEGIQHGHAMQIVLDGGTPKNCSGVIINDAAISKLNL